MAVGPDLGRITQKDLVCKESSQYQLLENKLTVPVERHLGSFMMIFHPNLETRAYSSLNSPGAIKLLYLQT